MRRLIPASQPYVWLSLPDSRDFIDGRADTVFVRGSLVRSGRWRPIFEDSVSTLLARSDFALPSPLAPPPDTGHHRLSPAAAARARGDLPGAERELEAALARMSEMNGPCHSLARLRALREDRSGAVATEEGCQRAFPQPLRRKEFEDFLRSAGR